MNWRTTRRRHLFVGSALARIARSPPSPFFKNVQCVRETEISVEQQRPCWSCNQYILIARSPPDLCVRPVGEGAQLDARWSREYRAVMMRRMKRGLV